MSKFDSEAGGKIPFIETEDVQSFIEGRGIKPEDFSLIEELSTIPKNTIIGQLHNFFQFSKERSAEELLLHIQNEKDDQQRRMYECLLAIVEKYDWTAAWNLVVVLERKR